MTINSHQNLTLCLDSKQLILAAYQGLDGIKYKSND